MEETWIIYVSFIIISSVGHGVYGDVQFQYDSEQCLGQPVEYQCNVTGSSFMIWRILDDEGVVVGTQLYTSYGGGVPGMIGVFTFEQLQGSPSIISNISFTVQSSINGYTIICEDVTNTVSENVTVQIPVANADPIAVLDFTNSSVNISWTDLSSSPCVTGYRYNISSSTPGWDNISMTTSSAMSFSAIVDGLVISTDPYHVIVTVDEKYTSRDSDESCFYFNVPPPVTISNEYVIESVPDTTTAMITITWTRGSYNEEECLLDPEIIFYVTIINNFDGSVYDQSITDGSFLYQIITSNSYTFTATGGNSYTINIIAENNIGNSSISYPKLLAVPVQQTTTSPSSSSSSTNSKSTSSISITPSRSTSTVTTTTESVISTTSTITTCPSIMSNAGLSSSVSAGISVAITVPVTAVITAIITVIILYLYQRRQSSNKATHPQIPSSTNEVEMKGNTAYGQVQYTTDTVNRPALYEELHI